VFILEGVDTLDGYKLPIADPTKLFVFTVDILPLLLFHRVNVLLLLLSVE
jgi:hypothetical protein